jgi:acyl-CoA dehydrogenase
MINPTATRERLAAGIYKPVEPGNQIGLLQQAMEIAGEVKALERRVFDAHRAGDIKSDDIPSQIDEAERKGILTPAEAEAVRAFDRRVLDVTGVDDFAPSELPRTAPRSGEGAKPAPPEAATDEPLPAPAPAPARTFAEEQLSD